MPGNRPRAEARCGFVYVGKFSKDDEACSSTYVSIALNFFKDQLVDYAVIETGLGGRVDSTNVIIPKVCGITSISLDHTEILGDTIEKIASENVDIKALGLYTLGNIRKDLDENTMNEYQELFQKYFLKSLTSRLTDYSSQKFEVIESEQKSSN